MVLGPLSYESLKCVLQYMEVNKRIHISKCCSSIRTAERTTPLKIDSLEFEFGQINLNNATYSIGIYKKFHVGEAPEPLKVQNDRGGVMFEVDKFGIDVRDDAIIVTPGDIDLRRILLNGHIMEAIEDVLERTIERMEASVQVFESLLSISRNRDKIRNIIRDKHGELIPLYYKRDHVPPSFENLIQLNVTSGGGPFLIEQYKHNKKYHDAFKQLGGALFGGRKQPIYVKTFVAMNTGFVIRLPVGVKFHIREIQFDSDVPRICDSLSPIIHKSSYPFKNLHVGSLGNEELTHPVIKKADIITFSLLRFRESIETLARLANRRVIVSNTYPEIFSTDVLNFFIRSRIAERQRTHVSFQFFANLPFGNWMVEVQKEFDGAILGERSVTIPMDGNSQLVVSHKESFDVEYNRPSWILEILVKDVDQ